MEVLLSESCIKRRKVVGPEVLMRHVPITELLADSGDSCNIALKHRQQASANTILLRLMI